MNIDQFYIPDLRLWGIAFALIAIITMAIQLLSVRLSQHYFSLRKVLHFSAILTCAYVIEHTERVVVLGWIFAISSLALWMIVRWKWLQVSRGKSWGIALFPLAFGLLLIVGIDARFVAIAAIILAVSDALAGIVGRASQQRPVTPFMDSKTWVGMLTFFLSCLIILVLTGESQESMIAWMLVAAIVTMAELYSYRGSDNFTIPTIAAILLYALSNDSLLINQGVWVIICSCIVLPILVRLRWLDVFGAIASGALGTVIALALPIAYLLYPLVFLVLGSVLSKLQPPIDKAEKKGRSARQVWANGSVAVLLCLWYMYDGSVVWMALFILHFTITLCDTASSEIGRYISGPTIDLLTLQAVPPGLSGGISLAGSIGGAMVAALIPMLGWFLNHLSGNYAIFIWMLGVMGMLIDSLVGSGFQAKYEVNQRLTDLPDKNENLIKGYPWMDNDLVNVVSIMITIAISYYFVA